MAILNNIGNLTKNLHHYVLLSTKINVVYYILHHDMEFTQNLGQPPNGHAFFICVQHQMVYRLRYIFPATGQIPDFHRLETCAAGRTHAKLPAESCGGLISSGAEGRT